MTCLRASVVEMGLNQRPGLGVSRSFCHPTLKGPQENLRMLKRIPATLRVPGSQDLWVFLPSLPPDPW